MLTLPKAILLRNAFQVENIGQKKPNLRRISCESTHEISGRNYQGYVEHSIKFFDACADSC